MPQAASVRCNSTMGGKQAFAQRFRCRKQHQFVATMKTWILIMFILGFDAASSISSLQLGNARDQSRTFTGFDAASSISSLQLTIIMASKNPYSVSMPQAASVRCNYCPR